jgi:hypothetical protein
LTRFGACIALILAAFTLAYAQRGRGAAAADATAKALAAVDLTGYWVSLVTEDWRYRMVTPEKGDYPSIPLNAEGRRVADAWDPAKDEAAGEQCKSYGAGYIIRQPGRLHITWEDDDTLRADFDAGTQTRLFHFGNWRAPESPATWQGNSTAQWEFAGGRRGRGQVNQAPGGDLKVVTTRMRPGYLQKNGVPYSANAVMTEYFDVVKEPGGDQWLVVKSIVNDPQYLLRTLIRSTHFRKQADAAGWNPTPCTAR